MSLAHPLLLLSLTYTASSLRCYTGYAIVKGSSIGTESKECGRDTDSCYNVTADVNSFSVLQKAGCNTLLCQFNENQCTQKHISGILVTFCCCKDADFCNNNSTVEDDGSLIDKGATVLKGITEILG